MPIPCQQCPLRRQPLFTPFTDEELAFQQRFKQGEIRVAAGEAFLHEGEPSSRLFTVLDGMGTRWKTLADGQRQIINFLLPGDLIGLQTALMGEAQYSAQATTPMTLCVFKRADLWEVYRSSPERAYDVTWIGAVEMSFLGETVTSLGQRDALSRVSWAFVRLYARLRATGLGSEGTVPLPFRQQDMADALGLSLVHTNKTVARLRGRGLADWRHGQLHVFDLDGLAAAAMTDTTAANRRPLL